jgi:hypothetical protein
MVCEIDGRNGRVGGRIEGPGTTMVLDLNHKFMISHELAFPTCKHTWVLYENLCAGVLCKTTDDNNNNKQQLYILVTDNIQEKPGSERWRERNGKRSTARWQPRWGTIHLLRHRRLPVAMLSPKYQRPPLIIAGANELGHLHGTQ